MSKQPALTHHTRSGVPVSTRECSHPVGDYILCMFSRRYEYGMYLSLSLGPFRILVLYPSASPVLTVAPTTRHL